LETLKDHIRSLRATENQYDNLIGIDWEGGYIRSLNLSTEESQKYLPKKIRELASQENASLTYPSAEFLGKKYKAIIE
jgi:hypothetical protein